MNHPVSPQNTKINPQNTQVFSVSQQAYLQGLMLGTDVARTIRNLPVLSGSGTQILGGVNTSLQLGDATSPIDSSHHLPRIHVEALRRHHAEGKTLVPEEIAKRDKSGLGMWDEIALRSSRGEFPKGTDVFLTKFHGLFYVAPAQNSFMCRMRIPGGVLRADQLAGIANIADKFAGGNVDITTRANLQIREIAPENAIDVLMELRDLGIVTIGAGADNIRNVTASTLSGIDPTELYETLPLARQLHYHIQHKPELYGLPRKFNIAFDGSGRISSLAETNDISWHAVQVTEGSHKIEPNIYFLLGLGGITGHGDFARPTGVLALPGECIAICDAILRVFILHGDRTNRKKARLKYLLDDWGFDRFLKEVEKEYQRPLRCVSSTDFIHPDHIDRWAHVDVHPQKQVGKAYLGVVLPVGRTTSDQCRGIAHIAAQYGSGEVRLTVWQNLIITDIAQDDIATVQHQIEAMGLDWRRTSVRAGLVACTGSAGCKYAGADTKRHAVAIAEYLEERFELDSPINIHLTGCHHSCAQHAIADIGLIATKVESNDASSDEIVDGYHVLVGGRTGADSNIGRVLFSSVPFELIPSKLERIIDHFISNRLGDECFAEFSKRIDWNGVDFPSLNSQNRIESNLISR